MKPSPSRIIWITADHMRTDHIASWNSPWMQTPNLNRIAESGVNFRECFAQSPLCMPSRCSFMTGLYPQQTGVTTNGHCLPNDFKPTVAHSFSEAGYITAQIGKLHFQPHEDMDFDPRERHDYGFDIFQLSEEAGCYESPWFRWLEGKYPEYKDAFRVPRPSSDERTQEYCLRPVDAPWQASQAGWIVDSAKRLLKSRADDRMFMHLGFYNPHPPLVPAREALDTYSEVEFPEIKKLPVEWGDKPEPLASLLKSQCERSSKELKEFQLGLAAMVTEMDLAIGSLIEYLESKGLLDDTLLVVSSDHGDMAGNHGMILKNCSFYDDIMRVPLILHWPKGLGKERRDITGLVELVDVMPTLLGLCNAPESPVFQGNNYAAELAEGSSITGRDDVIAYHEGGYLMLRSKDHKYIRYEATGGEVLFDLTENTPEVINLVDDSSQSALVNQIRDRALGRSLMASDSRYRRMYRF
ncbi:MAG: sulfatase-like hydrolase/transferase [Verrucomicrobiota bacterium]